MAELSQQQINVDLFDECMRRGARIAELESKLAEAVCIKSYLQGEAVCIADERDKAQAQLAKARELLETISPVDSGPYRLLAAMNLSQDLWVKRRDEWLKALEGEK